jgi:hypothetical protein
VQCVVEGIVDAVLDHEGIGRDPHPAAGVGGRAAPGRRLLDDQRLEAIQDAVSAAVRAPPPVPTTTRSYS